MRILVLASAPPYMRPSPKNPDYLIALKKAGLSVPSSDIENESAYMEAANGFAKRAKDIFQGCFQKIVKGVDDARSQGIKVDFFIISSRYGIVTECDLLLPYSFSLTRSPKASIRQFSEKLRIKELVKELLSKKYDLSVLIINKNDLGMIHDPKTGFDLWGADAFGKMLVIGAPSLSKVIGKHVKFVGTRSLNDRAVSFARYLDAITSTTLKDYQR